MYPALCADCLKFDIISGMLFSAVRLEFEPSAIPAYRLVSFYFFFA